MSRVGNQFTRPRTAEQKAEAGRTIHEFIPESTPAYAGSEIAAIRAARYCWECGETKDKGNHPR